MSRSERSAHTPYLKDLRTRDHVDGIGSMVVKMEHSASENIAMKSLARSFVASDSCHLPAAIICTGTMSETH